MTIEAIDISDETHRHVTIAQGTEEVYQGHPTTLLMPDGRTMYCVWCIDHGGPCGPLRRSDDGGLTWSDLLPVPENWRTVRNCPAIYRLVAPDGAARLFVFAGQGPDGGMHQSHSEDDGKSWTPMAPNGLVCVMPFCSIVPIADGRKLLGMTNIRRAGDPDKVSNCVAQSMSPDGGLTWEPWRVVVDMPGFKPGEPALVLSPDGGQLACLLRENTRRLHSLLVTSGDEGESWSEPAELPWSLTGDRHLARYADDGRLVVAFRDMAPDSPTKGSFVAWVGTYEDIINGREGQYRLKLLHQYGDRQTDCGYPGLELLPDGTFVATTYVKYRPRPEKNSVVTVRFRLDEIDLKAAGASR